MEQAAQTPCANCERLQSQVDALCQHLGAWQPPVAQLQERRPAAGKIASTSSKPPSSAIVKPKPPASSDGSKRSIGAKTGHPQHERALFPSQVATPFLHTLAWCPCCAGEL